MDRMKSLVFISILAHLASAQLLGILDPVLNTLTGETNLFGGNGSFLVDSVVSSLQSLFLADTLVNPTVKSATQKSQSTGLFNSKVSDQRTNHPQLASSSVLDQIGSIFKNWILLPLVVSPDEFINKTSLLTRATAALLQTQADMIPEITKLVQVANPKSLKTNSRLRQLQADHSMPVLLIGYDAHTKTPPFAVLSGHGIPFTLDPSFSADDILYYWGDTMGLVTFQDMMEDPSVYEEIMITYLPMIHPSPSYEDASNLTEYTAFDNRFVQQPEEDIPEPFNYYEDFVPPWLETSTRAPYIYDPSLLYSPFIYTELFLEYFPHNLLEVFSDLTSAYTPNHYLYRQYISLKDTLFRFLRMYENIRYGQYANCSGSDCSAHNGTIYPTICQSPNSTMDVSTQQKQELLDYAYFVVIAMGAALQEIKMMIVLPPYTLGPLDILTSTLLKHIQLLIRPDEKSFLETRPTKEWNTVARHVIIVANFLDTFLLYHNLDDFQLKSDLYQIQQNLYSAVYPYQRARELNTTFSGQQLLQDVFSNLELLLSYQYRKIPDHIKFDKVYPTVLIPINLQCSHYRSSKSLFTSVNQTLTLNKDVWSPAKQFIYTSLFEATSINEIQFLRAKYDIQPIHPFTFTPPTRTLLKTYNTDQVDKQISSIIDYINSAMREVHELASKFIKVPYVTVY